jgi:hypothetical protein
MLEFFSNPRNLLILGGVILLVIALNLPMFMILGGKKWHGRGENQWAKALRGGLDERRRQQAQCAELRRRVAELPDDLRQKPADQTDD